MISACFCSSIYICFEGYAVQYLVSLLIILFLLSFSSSSRIFSTSD
jgi:hypothetical protein